MTSSPHKPNPKTTFEALPDWVGAWGFAFGVGAFVGWAVSALLPQSITLASSTAGVIAGTAVTVYAGSIVLARRRSIAPRHDKPKVVHYQQQGLGVFLFSPTEWLTYHSLYSVSVIGDRDFEHMIGLGQVINIQENMHIQVSVLKRADGSESYWESLDRGSNDHLKNVSIRPAPQIRD